MKEHESTHGYSGPLKVSYGGCFTDVGRQALEVAAKYDPGRKVADDSNDLSTCDTYSVSRLVVHSRDGILTFVTTAMAEVS